MGLIEKLNQYGFQVIKSDRMFIGYFRTDVGLCVSEFADKCDEKIYYLKNQNGYTFPCNDNFVYVPKNEDAKKQFELMRNTYNKKQSMFEIKKMQKNGSVFGFKSSDLYSEYYDFPHNEELACCFHHGHTKRSHQYIEDVMSEIGLIKFVDYNDTAPNEEGFADTDAKKLFSMGYEDVCVGKLKNSLWLAETIHRDGIDGYLIIRMYFNHMPNVKELLAAFTIRRFAYRPMEISVCRECGRRFHWLDVEGDIQDKYEKALDHYCGC